jgi:uncharacterized protein YbjT (DUF2867 family)
MITVFGATGAQGGLVARALLRNAFKSVSCDEEHGE